jgi:hypothetical protein
MSTNLSESTIDAVVTRNVKELDAGNSVARMLTRHEVVTVPRGEGFAARCEVSIDGVSHLCGVTFGGFRTRAEAREALAHDAVGDLPDAWTVQAACAAAESLGVPLRVLFGL